MAILTWDGIGERVYETGVDRGVLYIPNSSGVYNNGVAWNGLTSVTESPSGAEPSAQYADNVKYLNLFSAEEFGATIEAFTYPDEFAPFDGLGVPSPGVTIGQQSRKSFGLSFRTRIGNDLDGDAHGYKLYMIYGCSASPSERTYSTVNDSPEAITFSWELTTVPVAVAGYTPTSIITVDSTQVSAGDLAELEQFLYGTAGTDPSLPTPAAVLAIFSGVLILRLRLRLRLIIAVRRSLRFLRSPESPTTWMVWLSPLVLSPPLLRIRSSRRCRTPGISSRPLSTTIGSSTSDSIDKGDQRMLQIETGGDEVLLTKRRNHLSQERINPRT